MPNQVNGLKDIYTILANERKLGGVIETAFIRLRSGEEYRNAVIANVDMIGSALYSVSFYDNDGLLTIVNVSEISIISEPAHMKVFELKNQAYKKIKTDEKLKYLVRLYEVNNGSNNPFFLEEAKMLIKDIGVDTAKQIVDVSFLTQPAKVYSIA